LFRYLPINEKHMQRGIFGNFIAKMEGGEARGCGSREFFEEGRLDTGA
jgi:hypothetical protein